MSERVFFEKFDRFSENVVLDNGLELIHFLYPNKFTCTVLFKIGFGSSHMGNKDENSVANVLPGTAHFLEHLMFWKKENNIYPEFFERSSLLNAFTDLDSTRYMCTSLPEYAGLNIEEIAYQLFNPSFGQYAIDREREVILSEYRSSGLEQQISRHQNMLSVIGWNASVRAYPTGDENHISKMDLNDLSAAHKQFYMPSNTKILLLGGQKPDLQMLKRLENYSSPCLPVEKVNLVKQHVQKKNTRDAYTSYPKGEGPKEVKVGFAFADTDCTYEMERKICAEIFSRGTLDLNSPLFEKNKIQHRFGIQTLSATGKFIEGCGFLMISVTGEQPLEFFESWYSLLRNDEQKISWLQYGKTSFFDAVLYESDYTRKLLDWLSDYGEYAGRLTELCKRIFQVNEKQILNFCNELLSLDKTVQIYE